MFAVSLQQSRDERNGERTRIYIYIYICLYVCIYEGMLNILYISKRVGLGLLGHVKTIKKKNLELGIMEYDVFQTLIEICCKSQSLKSPKSQSLKRLVLLSKLVIEIIFTLEHCLKHYQTTQTPCCSIKMQQIDLSTE